MNGNIGYQETHINTSNGIRTKLAQPSQLSLSPKASRYASFFFQNSVRSLKLKYVIDLADSQYQNVSLTDVEGFQEKKQQQDWASVTRHRAANAKPEVNRCCEACGARAAAVC